MFVDNKVENVPRARPEEFVLKNVVFCFWDDGMTARAHSNKRWEQKNIIDVFRKNGRNFGLIFVSKIQRDLSLADTFP